ncbi:MAG: hypothetical protein NZL95_04435 [Chitinophagales bacterium]|nr:hypothetical protein [Chitinophagales bacterium]MDW8427779.1 hypothetical protein [Chitinophagales bacterium]
MRFQDVIGQEKVKRQLRAAVASGKISHAYLFTGEEGYGTLPMALALATYLNCPQPVAEDACGECSSCRKLKKLMHPDLHVLFPAYKQKSGDKAASPASAMMQHFRSALLADPYMDYETWLNHLGAENKQLNISAEDCRSLLQRLTLRHFEGRFKIALIWHAGFLGKEGNILLKLLEEPPVGTLWLLIARTADELLPTIVSRCQQVSVGPIAEEDLADALIARFHLPIGRAQNIARISDGNWSEATRLAQQHVAAFAPLLLEWLRLLQSTDLLPVWTWVEQSGNLSREEQKAFLRYAVAFVRQSLLEHCGIYPNRKLDLEESQLANQLLSRLEPRQLLELFIVLERSHYFIERNVHARLVFWNLTLNTRSLIGARS